MSAARAFLYPAQRSSRNIDIVANTVVTKVLIEKQGGVGVEILEGRHPKAIRAAREVIVSAGAFNSQKLLLLSGIDRGCRLSYPNVLSMVSRRRKSPGYPTRMR
jgi:choline dehydrogenase